MAACDQKVVNVWVARVVPIVLIGIVGYTVWVLVALVCVNYLLHSQPLLHDGTRRGPSIAILVTSMLLLFPMAVSYFRILMIILADPGYIPRSSQWYESQREAKETERDSRRRHQNSSPEKADGPSGPDLEAGHLNGSAYRVLQNSRGQKHDTRGAKPADPSHILEKDVFVCANDGRPIWCSTCLNFKPDRAHHCSEVGRCVYKMDHFCPWTGGVVSELSFKFFVQFTTYAMLFCIEVLVVMAFFLSENRAKTGRVNVHWAVTLGFAGLFGMFAAGMSLTSIHLVLVNSTTIDNLSSRTKVYQLAVHVPHSARGNLTPGTYTTTPEMMFASQPDAPLQSAQAADSSRGNPSGSAKTFAILKTSPGENPWDLGLYKNWKSVMGDSWIDWFLPIRRSPCCNHGGESAYELGPVIERLKREAGIIYREDTPPPPPAPSQRRRRHKRSRILDRSGTREDDEAERSSEKRHRRRRKSRRHAADQYNPPMTPNR